MDDLPFEPSDTPTDAEIDAAFDEVWIAEPGGPPKWKQKHLMGSVVEMGRLNRRLGVPIETTRQQVEGPLYKALDNMAADRKETFASVMVRMIDAIMGLIELDHMI